jgi:hypothetical protein
MPIGKNEPDAGAAVTVPQVIVDPISKLTTAPHCPASLETTIFSGQVSLQNI